MSVSRPHLNFKTSPSGLLVPTVADDSALSAADVSFEIATPSDVTKYLRGAATPVFAQVKDSDLAVSDVTTNNVSTSAHGFAPKAPGSATEYLDGTGSWSTPAGGGGGGSETNSYAARVLNDSPKAFWKLVESGSPATLTDSSGSGFTLTCAGTVTGGQTDPWGGTDAILFGPGQATTTATITAAVDNFTIEFWAKIPSSSAHMYPIYIGDYSGGTNGLDIEINSNNFSAVVAGVSIGNNTLTLGTTRWHHIAVVRNNGEWTYFLDGFVDKLYVSSTAPTVGAKCRIAANVASANITLSGVAFYEKALPTYRIAAHYVVTAA